MSVIISLITKYMMMLLLGGYINIVIAVGHLVGLLWAEKMFEVTGIGTEMDQLGKLHWVLPYALTVFVAVVFFVFGLYGLSAYGKIQRLPWLKFGIFTISAIYILRGLAELVLDGINGTNSLSETLYSLMALIIGLLFLIGGLEKWKFKGISND